MLREEKYILTIHKATKTPKRRGGEPEKGVEGNPKKTWRGTQKRRGTRNGSEILKLISNEAIVFIF